MKPLCLARPGDRLSVLCLGAHADDVEIGAGGTILSWIAAGIRLDVTWCVLCANGTRAEEARNSAEFFLEGAAKSRVVLGTFDDGLLPSQYRQIKTFLVETRDAVKSDVVLTHCPDAHQDHRIVSEITWNLFRDHVILEYEIPKWDGDLGQPSLYVPLTTATLDAKIRLLEANFDSQRSKDWFDAETFRGLARLRGMECRAPERYAEAFRVRKLTISV